MQSSAKNVQEYLKELPADRRQAINAVRGVILASLPKGYEECMSYGMIGYVVPHSLYPKGYQCNPKVPLPFVNLGSQKNHMALHLMCCYVLGRFARMTPRTALIAWRRSAGRSVKNS